VIAAVFAVSVAASAQQSARDASDSDSSAPAVRGQRSNLVLWVLRKQVDSVDFQDATFEEVLDWVRDQGALNVVVQWRALAAEGISPDIMVTLKLENATVSDVLNEAMDQLSEVGSLRYRGVGNTLKISTKSDFERKLEVRVYDVTDILVLIPNFYGSPEMDIQQQSSGSGQQSGSQQLFTGGRSSRDESEQRRTGLDESVPGLGTIRNLIEDTIEPDTWDTYGGKSHISPFNRSLVIRAPIEIHEMIAGTFSYK